MKRTPLFSALSLSVLFIVAQGAQKTVPKAQKRGQAAPPASRQTKQPHPDKQPHADAKQAQTQSLTVREINETALAEIVGQKAAAERRGPLLVNFWATWCGPCREEFPDLVKIDEEYRAQGLQFITISLDDVAEINSGVPDFLKQMRATEPPAYLLNTVDQEAAILSIDRDWRGELPATFLYDRAGQVVFKHTGRIKPDELRAAIKKALAN